MQERGANQRIFLIHKQPAVGGPGFWAQTPKLLRVTDMISHNSIIRLGLKKQNIKLKKAKLIKNQKIFVVVSIS